MGQKISAGFGIALFTLCVTSVVSYRVITSFIQEAGRVEQSWRVLEELDEARNQLLTAEIGQRNYLLSGDESELKPYRLAVGTLQRAVKELYPLAGDDPDQRRRLDALEPLIAKATAELEGTIDLRRKSGAAAAWQKVLEGRDKQLEDAISQLLNELEGKEQNSLKNRQELFDTSARRMTFAVITRNFLALLFVAVASLIAYRDILMRNRAEAELARLKRQHELTLQSVADGIQVLDLQGKTTFVNPATARMLGYTVEELLGQSMHDILHHAKPNDTRHPREECPLSATLKDGNFHQETNEVFWRKDGSGFPVEYLSAPIREQGEVVGTVVTFRDISERRAVERMKDEFVSVVSHELRTPLTSIRGALGLLTSGLIGALPEKGQRMLEIAANNTERLVRLINDILDIERMQSGKVTMQRRVCDAATLMTQATDEMRAMADKAGVALSVSPQPVQLWADPDRVIQTLTNLLSNAIKFSPEGSAVWLTVTRQGPEARFAVKDQGRGIPADKLESIFERFQQVDASDARKKGGTGLGLAICRSIVQQHGGRTWAESVPGEGSTFFFTLPTLQEIVQDIASAVVDKRPLVLVCDDDPAILVVVGEVLDQHGYQAITVTSGLEAVRQAIAQRPAAILLDLVMPGMNGCETLMALKEKPETKDIPVIILSGLQPKANAALSANIVDWVHKPFDEGSLFLALKRAIDGQTKGARVLVVEDDSDLAGVLMAMFQRHGIETFHARTGREALRLSQRTLPDLLVLDLMLPDGDGFSVVDWLRLHDQLRRVPLVVYTAKDLDEAERQRLKLGQTQFFTKGRITPEDFEQRVIEWLNRLIPA